MADWKIEAHTSDGGFVGYVKSCIYTGADNAALTPSRELAANFSFEDVAQKRADKVAHFFPNATLTPAQ